MFVWRAIGSNGAEIGVPELAKRSAEVRKKSPYTVEDQNCQPATQEDDGRQHPSAQGH